MPHGDTGPSLHIPPHYGEPAAAQSMSTIAAPLVAAGALALFGVVVQAPDQFRWPGWTLLLLAATLALLLTCVQAGLWARYYFATPSEVRDWHYTRTAEEQHHVVRHELSADQGPYFRWSALAWWCFVAGLLVLWVALATAAAPQSAVSAGAPGRIAAALLCVAMAMVEVVWIFGVRLIGRR